MTSAASSPRRYLALWFPFLPIDRLGRPRRGGPASGGGTLADGPLAVVEPVRGAMRLVATCRQARALGLMPGLTLADARARTPGLGVIPRDPVADAAFLEGLADAAGRVTPSVAIELPDGLALDVTGCAHLFGGEARLRRGLLALYSRRGVEALAAFGPTPDAARALARFDAFLGPAPERGDESVLDLPVAALELPDEVRVAITRAGLKRIGDLAARPAATLAARFGAESVTRLRRILGQEDRRVAPRRPLPPLIVEQSFAEPIGRVEDAEATLALLLRRVAALLAEREEGAREIEAAFFRTDGVVRRVRVAAGRPSRDADSLLRLFRDRLETLADPLDPGFGFDLVRLSVFVAEPLGPVQEAMDGTSSDRAAEAVAGFVDRLSARFGREAVLRFVPVDSHDPHRAAQAVPAQGSAPLSGWPEPPPGEPPLRPLQVFDPPQPIEAVALLPDDPPVRFRWRGVLHEVALAEGPERLLPEWWRDGPSTRARVGRPRDYYRVEDRQGRRFWVFRVDGRAGPRWFLHGLFA